MCRPATCRTCGKASWKGCGQHVDQVMRGVPKAERCTCASDPKVAPAAGGSFLSRLLGR